jgi:hypothetical protein
MRFSQRPRLLPSAKMPHLPLLLDAAAIFLAQLHDRYIYIDPASAPSLTSLAKDDRDAGSSAWNIWPIQRHTLFLAW